MFVNITTERTKIEEFALHWVFFLLLQLVKCFTGLVFSTFDYTHRKKKNFSLPEFLIIDPGHTTPSCSKLKCTWLLSVSTGAVKHFLITKTNRNTEICPF